MQNVAHTGDRDLNTPMPMKSLPDYHPQKETRWIPCFADLSLSTAFRACASIFFNIKDMEKNKS